MIDEIAWKELKDMYKLDIFMKIFYQQITNFGGLIFYLFIIVLTYLIDYKRIAFLLLIGLIVGTVLGLFIKNLFKIKRPNNKKYIVLDGYSFPSIHSIRVVILTIFFFNIYTVLFAAIIIYSRVVLKEHRIIDVVAGVIIGLIIGGALSCLK